MEEESRESGNGKRTRRQFFAWVGILLSGAVLAGIVGTGLLAYFFPPKRFRKKIGGWQQLKPVGEYPEGEAVPAIYFGIPLFVLRWQGAFRAFSAVCPHLGCIVKWDSEQKVFPCPCHDSYFDAAGIVQKGPARPYNLLLFEVKEEEGYLFVDLPDGEKLEPYPSWFRYAMQYGG